MKMKLHYFRDHGILSQVSKFTWQIYSLSKRGKRYTFHSTSQILQIQIQ